VRILVDTNILLWALGNDPRLSRVSSATLTDERNILFASAISLAEMHSKRRIGKLDIPDDIERAIEDMGCDWLPFDPVDAPLLSALPLHHRDPFDRMLIAQATRNAMTILTSDSDFLHYPVQVILNS
jgi:PIN domain nuclease of toxin-antitoxin system